jgi:GT2 family glycosyltransferase
VVGDSEKRVIAASFVIPTRGRVDNAVGLLQSIRQQRVPVEVLVMDDGDSGELRGVLARDFPEARYYSLATGRGPAFQRNHGIALAAADIVFPLDDDTLLSSPDIVSRTIDEFDDARIAAVAIPYINVRYTAIEQHRAPDSASIWVVHAFTGASHAIRRSAFLAAGGYREHFFYMGEEGDLCLRLLNRGMVVRAGTSDPIHHLESPHRDSELADYCGRRNDLLFAWHNVPTSRLPLHLAGTTMNGIVSSLRAPHTISSLRGMAGGFAQIARRSLTRQPVIAPVYRLQRRLKSQGPLSLGAIEAELPKLARAC